MISFMHKKAIWIISVFCVLTFGHSLFNDFVGDDYSFILENDFYQKPSNVSCLFSRDYSTDSDAVFNRDPTAIVTGSVAYRPVLSMTYFIDYALWGINPFGYHLTNLLLHLLSSFLVYFCVWSLIEVYFSRWKKQSWGVPLLSAIIFCVHPLKAEPVCSIGYRADLLSSFFVLFSFLVYLSLRSSTGWHKPVKLILSYLFFLMGIFSKESVTIYPLILLSLEWAAGRLGSQKAWKRMLKVCSGYFLVLGLYAYVYCFVIPNSSLRNFQWLGGSFVNHVLSVIYFVSTYLSSFFFPNTVKMLPPVYFPPLEYIRGVWALLSLGGILAFFSVWGLFFRKEKVFCFGMYWFLISLLPVLNLIPIVNPFAYRFLYFPSIGLSLMTGLFLWRAGQEAGLKNLKANFFVGVKWTYILSCMIVSFFLVFAWKNNFVAAKNMISDFPESPVGYMLLSVQYQRNRLYEKASELALRSLERGSRDPRSLYILAYGLAYEKECKKAHLYYAQCCSRYPRYAPCFVGQGKLYLMKGDVLEALSCLQKSVEISPSFSGYFYLLQSVLMRGDLKAADKIYGEAVSIFKNPQEMKILNKIYALYSENRLPFDIINGEIVKFDCSYRKREKE